MWYNNILNEKPPTQKLTKMKSNIKPNSQSANKTDWIGWVDRRLVGFAFFSVFFMLFGFIVFLTYCDAPSTPSSETTTTSRSIIQLPHPKHTHTPTPIQQKRNLMPQKRLHLRKCSRKMALGIPSPRT